MTDPVRVPSINFSKSVLRAHFPHNSCRALNFDPPAPFKISKAHGIKWPGILLVYVGRTLEVVRDRDGGEIVCKIGVNRFNNFSCYLPDAAPSEEGAKRIEWNKLLV